jgi:TRAP-type C4-dicarboxylate transport system permease small subunit
MTTIDRISLALGIVAAIMLFLTGAFLTYEVVMRYVFRAPTSWAQEVSEIFLLWGVFLALGRIVKLRENISIEVVYDRLPAGGQRFVDVVALTIVALFFAFCAKYGFDLAWESLEKGTTTGTMVDIPSWIEEAAIPVGCGWAAIQSVVEVIRALTGRGWDAMTHQGKDI